MKKAYLRVSVETAEQFDTVCQIPSADLIYLDAGLFPAEKWNELAAKAHKGTGGFGKLAGLRLPQIWRKRTEAYFADIYSLFENAGFDVFLARNPEEVLWLIEAGIPEEKIVCDHTIYRFNELSEKVFSELTETKNLTKTWSLELNCQEIRRLSEKLRLSDGPANELVVYGRANLMVTAQCIRKTSIGCDRRSSLMWLKDRTGAMMPVRNCCTFCINTVYNAVPTVLFDLETETGSINPEFIRYEFTSEDPEEVKSILSGNVPEKYTRGHFKRGVL